MERAKGVVIDNRKLREIEGVVESLRSALTGYGCCLHIELRGVEQDIWWQGESEQPIGSVRAGDYLRGFYENPDSLNGVLSLEAYELYDSHSYYIQGGNAVLHRNSRPFKRGSAFHDSIRDNSGWIEGGEDVD